MKETNKDDEYFLKEAIKEAKKALKKKEVPVGAIVVQDGKIIARGHNTKETSNNILKHAELIAIEKASKKLGKWRLLDCDIYVTLEPCLMCASAISQARFKRLIYGLDKQKLEGEVSPFELVSFDINKKIEIKKGILSEEIKKIMGEFFKELRNEKKKQNEN